MDKEPLYLDEVLVLGHVYLVGYIPLIYTYQYFRDLAKEKNIQRSSFLVCRLDGLHDLMIKYLPKLFDELVLKKRNRASEKCMRTLLTIGYSKEDVFEFYRIFVEDCNTLLNQTRVDFPQRLFLHLDEDEADMPTATISYVAV